MSKLVGIWKAYDEASFVVSDTEDVPGMTKAQRINKCVEEIITTEIEHVKVNDTVTIVILMRDINCESQTPT